MTTKMRVRELSSELDVSNKELIQLLRRQGIQVKSHMSGLTEDQVELVRSSYQDSGQQEQPQEKMTASGVIVRRRKRKVAPQEPPRDRGESAAEAEPESAETQEEPPPAETGGAASGVEPEQAPPAEEGEETAAPADSQEEEAAESAALSGGAEPSAEESEEAQAKKHKKRSRKKKKEGEQPASPSVTIISRPEPAPEPGPAAAPQPAGSEAGAEREEKTEKRGRGKKKSKDKRVVDVTGLYEEKEPAKQQREWKQKKAGPSESRAKKGARKKPGPSREKRPSAPQPSTQPTKAAKRKIRMEEAIRVADLAQELGVKAQEILKTLLSLGVMANINQSLDVDTATLVAAEFGYEVEKVGFSEEEYILPSREDQPEELQSRPPVVTIMGHVDHGKTSLLDGIRESHIVEKEAGGITQHIGAYHVERDTGSIVFLDTPGHEAFTEMRSRGAQVTDVVILIVAADDGVMDQTKEAINHAKAAGVPIVVAVNKVDKDNADPTRVRRELAEQDLIAEEWGGETIFCELSAKQRTGIDHLMEMVLLQSEVLDLKANPNKRARGHIVEARLDKGRGPVATLLVQEGTLHSGDSFVCGLYHGKVRALFNDRGHKIKSAGPAMPVEVQGFEGVPNAGDEFVVVENEKVAKRIAEERQTKQREKELAKESKVTLESFFAAKQAEEVKTLNLVLKADVHGSLEAITEAVNKLSTESVKVDIIHGGIGAITESDIKLASASAAVIIGFNVRPTSKVKEMAESEGVDVRFYNVIYQLVNDVKEAMAGLLEPVTREVYLGQAEVRNTFSVPKVGVVAGCYVTDGKLQRNAMVRLLRDGVVIVTGKIDSLKRFKDDAREVAKGYECGVGLENYNDIKVGDIIEAFQEVREKATLE
jgi:translation initiation factor IF-2